MKNTKLVGSLFERPHNWSVLRPEFSGQLTINNINYEVAGVFSADQQTLRLKINQQLPLLD